MLLTVRDLWVAYGKIAAVRGVDLEVDEGEIVALLGPNGAGKSSVLRAISGMRPPVQGEVVFVGRRVSGWASDRIARLGMSLVPEGRGLFSDLTVEENLRMGGFFADPAVVRQRIDHVCAIFPVLGRRLEQRAGTLSGGEQQQLAIARALVSQPRLLVLDEMSLGLAPLVVADLYRTIAEINRQGTSVLLVEQQVALALRVAHRAYFMERGEIVLAGTAAEVAERQLAHTYFGGTGSAPTAAASEEATALELVRVPLRSTQTRALQRLAAQRGRSVGEVVAEAVTSYLSHEAAVLDGPLPAGEELLRPRREAT